MPAAFRTLLISSLVCTVAVGVVTSIPVIPQNRLQRVAFVGCPSDGQTGYLEPPPERLVAVILNEVSPGEISYYKAEAGWGAFAPSGWHCHAWYGSGGATVLITPEVPDSGPESIGPAKTSGEAVELTFYNGENSGRSDVAKYGLLFFPQAAAEFIQSVNEILDEPISPNSLQPFAKDSIRGVSSTMAEFVTSGDTAGFGTEGHLRPSSDPISGIALLDQSNPDSTNFVTLRIRLQPANSNLKDALLRLNKECMQEHQPCSTQ